MYASIQKNDFSKDYPIILTSGRLVEYEGGGDESRSNPWLAELQQDMFVEIHPRDANNLGVRDGEQVWVEGAEGAKVKVMAMVTERVGEGVAFMPFHFGGHFQGADLRDKYPDGADPYVLGESSNTAQTYGYDSVTQMQETKVYSLQNQCSIRRKEIWLELSFSVTPSAASNATPVSRPARTSMRCPGGSTAAAW